MNAQTKHALEDLATKVQMLAQGVAFTVGLETAQAVVASAEMLKIALKREGESQVYNIVDAIGKEVK